MRFWPNTAFLGLCTSCKLHIGCIWDSYAQKHEPSTCAFVNVPARTIKQCEVNTMAIFADRRVAQVGFPSDSVPGDLQRSHFRTIPRAEICAQVDISSDPVARRSHRRLVVPPTERGQGTRKNVHAERAKTHENGVLGSFRGNFSHRGVLAPAKAQVRRPVNTAPYFRSPKNYLKPRKRCTFASRSCTFFSGRY